MRICLTHLSGNVMWTNADTDEQLSTIHKVGLDGTMQSFTFVEEVKTKTHQYRRYQEIVTDETQ